MEVVVGIIVGPIAVAGPSGVPGAWAVLSISVRTLLSAVVAIAGLFPLVCRAPGAPPNQQARAATANPNCHRAKSIGC